MRKTDVDKVFAELAKYKLLQKETEKVIEDLSNQIKSYMTKKQYEELVGKEHRATYKLVESSRIDSKALAEAHPRIAKKFTVDNSYMRLNFR